MALRQLWSPVTGLLLKQRPFLTLAFATDTKAVAPVTDWKSIKLPAKTVEDLPTTMENIAFEGDIRSTSGLGVGDGLSTHTAKWLQGNDKTPMEWIAEAEPIKVSGLVVASHGTDDPALGCPVEFISLKGTSRENPAVCKYTGNRYYSDDWKGGGHH